MDEQTETFETYDDPSYEWDYEETEDRPPKVLWGRVVALGIFVIAAFVVGRWTAPTDASVSALRAAQADLTAAEGEIQALEQQLSAQSVTQADTEDEAAAEATPAADETTEAVAGKKTTYIVRSGDTLAAIALRFYDDSTLEGLIAEANDIDDPRSIKPGQKLVIPPKPSG